MILINTYKFIQTEQISKLIVNGMMQIYRKTDGFCFRIRSFGGTCQGNSKSEGYT